MSTLSGSNISQTYQGLLKMTDSTSGVTGTLQTVQSGDGTNTPLQISQTQVNISGSLTINGNPVTNVNTGSFVTTSSFNAYTSSVDTKLDGLDIETGSLQNQINGLATTGSLSGYTTVTTFNNYTSSNDSKVNSLISKTGSYATTGSNQFNGNQSISGSVQASSTVTSLDGFVGGYFGSNINNTIYGNTLVDIKTSTTSNNGKVRLYSNGNYPFRVEVSGSLNVRDGITGSLQGTASYATQALSASYAPDNSNRNGLINTGSIGGSQSITGSLNVGGTLTATSASITYLETVYETASVIYSSGSNQFGDASNDTQTLFGTVNLPNGPLTITGSLHQSGTFYPDVIDWFSSSIVQNTGSYVLTTDALGVTQYDSYQNVASALQPFISGNTVASASFAATASIAFDLVVNGKCDNPGGLTKGTIVRITGANGDNPLFNSASWTDDFNSANTLGMLTENVAYNGFANIVTQGTVIGINTDNMTAGDMLYLSSSGQYTTSSVPAPYHEVRLGQVLRPQLNNGSAYISIDNGYELTELHDVDITNPVDGDLLVYRSGSYGQWVNEDGAQLGFATTGSNTFTGFQRILNDLEINSSNPVGTFVSMISTGTTSFLMNSPLTQFQSNGEMLFKNTISSTGSADINFRTENGGDITFNTSNSGSVAITGSVNISGSANFIGPVGLNLLQPNPFKQNLTLLGAVNHFTSSTVLNNYLNAITTSLDNDDQNFVLPPGGGLGSNIATLTGSVFISGSNNIITNLGSGTPASVGRRQVIGSGNYIIASPTINTSSLTIPTINNNYNAGGLTLTLTTGSNLGNQAHSYAGNVNIGTILWNHPSASIVGQASVIQNNVNVGGITSTTIGPTLLTASAQLQNNIVSNVNVALNHQSSSINFSQNIVGGNGFTVNNRYYQTGSNNFLAATANIFGGQTITINAGGSPTTNVTRTLVGNIIGGQNVVASLEANNTDLGGLRNSLIYGQGIIVSGSHSVGSTAVNSTVMVGRWNDENNGLADSARTVFAVGTGTGAGNRRTGFSIDSGSNVVTSGSFSSIGNVNVTGSLNVSGSGGTTIKLNGDTSINGVTNVLTVTGSANITHNIAGQNALTIINSVGLSQPGLEVQGQTTLLGNTLISGSAIPLKIVGQSMTNVGLQVTGTTTLIGNTTISGSDPLRVGVNNNKSVIQSLGGSQWLYRDSDNNTVVGNAFGVGNGFFAGSEKNMIFNGFATDFATGSNNVLIQGGGDNFISGSGNVFIGNHNGHAGGSNNILIGGTSYSSGSIFDSKFELGTLATSRIFHKQGTDPLQIGDDTQVTGSLSISTVMNLKPQNPLPSGNIGDLAVSSSNQLYFYNGAWTLVV